MLNHIYIMILSALLTIITTLITSLLLTVNPLSIALTIILLALILSLTFSLFISSWYSFLIFLIYVGGILVIFSYFVALTPNQQNLSPLYPIVIIISILLIIFTNLNLPQPSILNYSPQTNLIYITSNSTILIILALILLFTIIVVVKICIHTKGPLRPFSL